MHTGDWSNQGGGLIVQNQEAMKPDNYTEVETALVLWVSCAYPVSNGPNLN